MTFTHLASSPRLARALATALVAASPGACTNDKTPGDSTDTADPGTTEPASGTDSESTTQGEPTVGSTTEDATTVEPTSSTSTTTEPPTDPSSECACIDTERQGPTSYVCPKGPCDTVRAECLPDENMQGSGFCEEWGVFTVDEADLDCALDQLIAGDVGYVEFTFTRDQGFSEEGGFVGLLPGREGLMRTWDWLDLGGEWSSAGVVPLKDASYFEGCKSEADLQAKFWCMTAWATEEPAPQCDGPDSGSDI